MKTSRTLATADEIRAYLVGQLNMALTRPGMYGGEQALSMLVDHLLVVESRPEECHESAMASVYAEFAHRCDWLLPERVLPMKEYEALRGRARQWAAEDRTWADVTAEFGSPSVRFGARDPRSVKTAVYIGEDPAQPMVVFHLGAGRAVSEAQHEQQQAVLLAVRCGDGPLPTTFTFAPEGYRRTPPPDRPCGT
ncbi:hypothetical protein [Streptomyces sp. NPDC048603]|uniref:hypothetical protein n=1 Tax=Streptomyces sp. NPDC048603 TaxID=3365577 RepID=UPI00371E2D7D